MIKMDKTINFTSATTTACECIKALLHSKDKKDYIEAYHEKIKEILGVKYALSFAGGRMALYSILKALEIGSGDEVIIQGYTCCVVPKAIIYSGARPVYADITDEDYNLDYESVKNRITSKTKAVIVQHTYGVPCHAMENIKKLCHDNGIYMIEDCAHTFGTEYKGKILGTFGDAAFFSTDHTKYISTSVGGVAITNDERIGNKLREIYNATSELTNREKKAVVVQYNLMNITTNKYICHFLNRNKVTRRIRKYTWLIVQKLQLTYYMNDYSNTDFPKYTFPAKLSNVQAMVGISQLNNLDNNTKYRIALGEMYKEKLGGIFYIPDDCEAFLRIPIMVNEPQRYEEEMKDFLKVERWFAPALECIQEEDYEKFYYNKEECPTAQKIANHIINLPVHLKVTEKEIDEICARVLDVYKKDIK